MSIVICPFCAFDEINVKYVDTHEYFFYKCYACMHTWATDITQRRYMSALEKTLVKEADKMRESNIDLKPCPFCGKELDISDPDVWHPSNREHTEWVIHCPEHACGCGVEMYGETRYDVVEKWNRRNKKEIDRV